MLWVQGSKNSPKEIINCIIIDLYPELTYLFVVVIIAMCLEPRFYGVSFYRIFMP